MQSLELDNARRHALIDQEVMRPLRKFVRLFAGTTGSYNYQKLQTGRSRYFRIVAVK